MAVRYKTVFVSNALPSALLTSLLHTLKCGDVDIQISVHRILHALLDRHGNLANLQHIRFVDDIHSSVIIVYIIFSVIIVASEVVYLIPIFNHTGMQRPDLQNILRQYCCHLMIIPKLRLTLHYIAHLIYKTSYKGREAFFGTIHLQNRKSM